MQPDSVHSDETDDQAQPQVSQEEPPPVVAKTGGKAKATRVRHSRAPADYTVLTLADQSVPVGGPADARNRFEDGEAFVVYNPSYPAIDNGHSILHGTRVTCRDFEDGNVVVLRCGKGNTGTTPYKIGGFTIGKR
jgi:hypothetical protein